MAKFFLLLSIAVPAVLLVAAIVNAYREGDDRRRLAAREALGFEVHKWW